MSQNLINRKKIIDGCLTNKYKPFPSKQEIIEKCSEMLGKYISESSIEKDFQSIENEYDVIIKYSKKHKGYYYDDEHFSIENHGLKTEDLTSIEYASALLHQYRNLPIFEKYSVAIDKIMHVVKFRKNLDQNKFEKYIQLEQVPFIKGTEFIEPILQAIIDKQVLNIKSHTYFEKDAYSYIVHPYLLKEYRNRWYVIGLDNYDNLVKSFCLDRFVTTEINSKEKYRQSNFDSKNYFKYTIGIVAPRTKPKIIKILLDKYQAQYLILQPIHNTQKVLKETKDKVLFYFEINPTYEFESLVLSWGNTAKIISPKSFRERIINLLNESIKNYKN